VGVRVSPLALNIDCPAGPTINVAHAAIADLDRSAVYVTWWSWTTGSVDAAIVAYAP
jgi:hypothetical protein